MSDFDKWFNEQGRINGYPEDLLLIKGDLESAWNAGRAAAERELRAPGPCHVSGHTQADWVPIVEGVQYYRGDGEPEQVGYCAACRREQEMRMRVVPAGPRLPRRA